MAIYDHTAEAGIRTTYGSVPLADHVLKRDVLIVERLRVVGPSSWEPMIPVAAIGQPGVIQKPGEDTPTEPTERRVLAAKYFFLACLLDNVVEHF